MKKLLPKYFDSEWSFAQFRVPDAKTICAFTNDNRIIGKLIFNYKYILCSNKHGRKLLPSKL